jgi:xanthine/CO dehydrogenase XdhC/CoxF family maturation factor
MKDPETPDPVPVREEESVQVLRRLAAEVAAGRTVALATVVRVRGSVPRKAGARMVVAPDGRILAGTVGGGCGEGEVLDAARETLRDGVLRTVQVDLTQDLLSLSPAVCGGIMEVMVERVDG